MQRLVYRIFPTFKNIFFTAMFHVFKKINHFSWLISNFCFLLVLDVALGKQNKVEIPLFRTEEGRYLATSKCFNCCVLLVRQTLLYF